MNVPEVSPIALSVQLLHEIFAELIAEPRIQEQNSQPRCRPNMSYAPRSSRSCLNPAGKRKSYKDHVLSGDVTRECGKCVGLAPAGIGWSWAISTPSRKSLKASTSTATLRPATAWGGRTRNKAIAAAAGGVSLRIRAVCAASLWNSSSYKRTALECPGVFLSARQAFCSTAYCPARKAAQCAPFGPSEKARPRLAMQAVAGLCRR